jgi:hypothetical protein
MPERHLRRSQEDFVTPQQVEANIQTALGEDGSDEERLRLAVVAVAQALLLQAEKQDELIELLRSVRGGDGAYASHYLEMEVRAV